VTVLRAILKFIVKLLLALIFVASTAWGTLAVHYSDLGKTALGSALAGFFAIFSLVVLVGIFVRRWRGRSIAAYGLVFAGLIAWWSAIAPSNGRNWKPEVAKLPLVSIDGDRIAVRNIRNFAWRTEAEFTPAYYDKTFELSKLDSVDLIAVYWGSPAIAHMMVSFNFGTDDHLDISIERRDEIGETYSTIKGLFKQYELFYVVADERDVIRLRTNVRVPREDVYVYRLKGPIEDGRRLFLEYMKEINSLASQPEFYNTLTTNCTGNIWLHSKVNPGSVPYSWKILLSGYVPEYLYEQGKLGTSLLFPELQRRSRVNTAAQAADQAADFSRRIRAGLPE